MKIMKLFLSTLVLLGLINVSYSQELKNMTIQLTGFRYEPFEFHGDWIDKYFIVFTGQVVADAKNKSLKRVFTGNNNFMYSNKKLVYTPLEIESDENILNLLNSKLYFRRNGNDEIYEEYDKNSKILHEYNFIGKNGNQIIAYNNDFLNIFLPYLPKDGYMKEADAAKYISIDFLTQLDLAGVKKEHIIQIFNKVGPHFCNDGRYLTRQRNEYKVSKSQIDAFFNKYNSEVNFNKYYSSKEFNLWFNPEVASSTYPSYFNSDFEIKSIITSEINMQIYDYGNRDVISKFLNQYPKLKDFIKNESKQFLLNTSYGYSFCSLYEDFKKHFEKDFYEIMSKRDYPLNCKPSYQPSYSNSSSSLSNNNTISFQEFLKETKLTFLERGNFGGFGIGSDNAYYDCPCEKYEIETPFNQRHTLGASYKIIKDNSNKWWIKTALDEKDIKFDSIIELKRYFFDKKSK